MNIDEQVPSANIYVASAHKATAVSHCMSGYFTGTKELYLCIAKCTILEIHLIASDGLKFVKELNINGKVAAMLTFKKDNRFKKDFLFVATARGNAMILECSGNPDDFDVLTKAHGQVAERVGKCSHSGVIAAVDPQYKVIALHLHDGLLHIIKIQNCTSQLNVTNHRLREREIQEIRFLYNHIEPTFVLIHHDVMGRHINLRAFSLAENQVSSVMWRKENVNEESNLIIAVPHPLGGMIVFSEGTIMYHDLNQHMTVSPPEMKGSTISCYAKIGKAGLKFVLGDMKGKLFLFQLDELHLRKKCRTYDLKFDLLGETSVPESICYLDDGLLYVASIYGDSKLIRLREDENSPPRMTVLESYANLGPIMDMIVVDLEQQGQGQIITCSGGNKEGSLRVIRNGIGIQIHASIEVAGTTGAWPLKSLNPDMDDILVLSFVAHTSVLKLNGEELEECALPGIRCNLQTLFCSNVGESSILQITTNSVILVSRDCQNVVSEWKVPLGKTISVVSSNGIQVACASGSELYYLEVIGGQIEFIKKLKLTYDISCVDISPVNGKKKADYMAVCLWMSISVCVFKINNNFELVHEESLEVDFIARSVLMVTLEGISYLMCAMGDGSLFHFTFDAGTGILDDQTKVIVGTKPVTLQAFQSQSKNNVFVCSDRPAIIYSKNKRLTFSNVNLKLANYMSAINTEVYPECLVVEIGDSVIFGKIDGIQKMHVRTVPLGEHPKNIAYQALSKTFGVLSVRMDHYEGNALVPNRASASTGAPKTSTCPVGSLLKNTNKVANVPEEDKDVPVVNLLIVDQNTFEILHACKFTEDEHALSIQSMNLGTDPRTFYVVGTGYVNPEEPQPTIGRLMLFTWEDNKLYLIYERRINGGCYELSWFNGKLLVVINNTVQLYEWTDKRQLRLRCSHSNNIIVTYLKAKGDFIFVGDLTRSVTILRYIENSTRFEEIARDNMRNFPTAIGIIDDDKFIAAESNLNLVAYEINCGAAVEEERHRLLRTGIFHLGDQINIFRHGSMVMKQIQDAYKFISNESILFGTLSGAIGLVLRLPDPEFNFLQNLEYNMRDAVQTMGEVDHKFWRSMDPNKGHGDACRGIIDGDLVESFLELTLRNQEEIASKMKGVGHCLKDKDDKKIVVADVVKLVELYYKMH